MQESEQSHFYVEGSGYMIPEVKVLLQLLIRLKILQTKYPH